MGCKGVSKLKEIWKKVGGLVNRGCCQSLKTPLAFNHITLFGACFSF